MPPHFHSPCGIRKSIPKKAFLILYKLKKPRTDARLFEFFGSPTWTRTRDLRINSPSLYRLSYQGTAEKKIMTGILLAVKTFLHPDHFRAGMRSPV